MHTTLFGQKGHQRSNSRWLCISKWTSHDVAIKCVYIMFHAFIKKCTIHSLSLSMLLHWVVFLYIWPVICNHIAIRFINFSIDWWVALPIMSPSFCLSLLTAPAAGYITDHTHNINVMSCQSNTLLYPLLVIIINSNVHICWPETLWEFKVIKTWHWPTSL